MQPAISEMSCLGLLPLSNLLGNSAAVAERACIDTRCVSL
jgi:hypothetical protein